MSEGMPFNWRSFAKASSSRLKGYIGDQGRGQTARSSTPPGGGQQGWREWASQKIKEKRQNYNGRSVPSLERVSLFPGWATRRYHLHSQDGSEDQFEIDVFVSGFASSHQPFDLTTRSQRTFVRLAKGFASLPKLVAEVAADHVQPARPTLHLSPSTEELLRSKQLPPRPDEITEEYEIQALEKQFQNASVSAAGGSPAVSRASSVDESSIDEDISTALDSPLASMKALSRADILRLHNNLETRIKPFWSSVLPSRTVRIHIFTSAQQSSTTSLDQESFLQDVDDPDHGPIATADVKTGIDGSFQARLKVKWEHLCQHPHALHIAFGEPGMEHDLVVVAQLLPLPSSANRLSTSSNIPSFLPGDTLLSVTENTSASAASATSLVSLTHSPLRVISDIDDTIKHSGILSGARTIFRNVFVRDLQETVIPGMGEWYTRMWQQGVRFHYVSNGPFELLPIVNEFFQISQLPPGSVKLKSYAGRSFFNGLLSAPAARKRAGVVDILDCFSESQFLLIGDSGEQDLELYADIARERPDQILAVFIRDVDIGDPLDDPTGAAVVDMPLQSLSIVTTQPRKTSALSALSTPSTSSSSSQSSSSRKQRSGGRISPNPPTDNSGYFTRPRVTEEPDDVSSFTSFYGGMPISTTPNTTPKSLTAESSNTNSSSNAGSTYSSSAYDGNGHGRRQQSLAEKRRSELQLRVYRARTIIPERIRFRVFRSPEDCVEAEEILKMDSSTNVAS